MSTPGRPKGAQLPAQHERTPVSPARQRERGSVDGTAAVDLTSPDQAAELALPHERDETVGMTGGVQSPLVQQAARDLKRGVTDTSGAVEANETYKRLKK